MYTHTQKCTIKIQKPSIQSDNRADFSKISISILLKQAGENSQKSARFFYMWYWIVRWLFRISTRGLGGRSRSSWWSCTKANTCRRGRNFSKISFMSILCGTMSSELTFWGVSTGSEHTNTCMCGCGVCCTPLCGLLCVCVCVCVCVCEKCVCL